MATDKTFTGFKIPNEVLAKAKYIAWFERETLTAKIVDYLDSEILKFEKKNGAITDEQIKKSAKK